MEGRIEVQSPINFGDPDRPGTRFTVTLPLWDAAAAPAPAPALAEGGGEPAAPERMAHGGELRILLIDDNEDLRDFLGRELAEKFDVACAENGAVGLRMARDLVPDLVIADVMMPEMNGIEFCRALKSDPSTSHIPVIMLTARSSPAFEQLGLESGADEYLTKPISLTNLELRISNLLETRSRLQERLRAQVLSEPAEPEVPDAERDFLKRIVGHIDRNLQDGSWGVDELAEAMGQSRSSLYRKLKAIAGESPNDFIKRYRMQRAGQLLLGSKLSVSEVMYEVGYQELGHFGKLFKAHFGHSPTQHRSRGGKETARL